MLFLPPSTQAALTINSIDVPTPVGRGQTVPVPVNCTRALGAGAEIITVACGWVEKVTQPE